ncbi:hypothetical protein AALA69_03190 [Eggerthellaceae bacterium 24-137]
MTRLCISGPVTNVDLLNYPAFERARAALAAVLVPLGLVCWMSLSEVRRCR